MTPVATVLKPGLFTSIQDMGRPGARHYGVPQSGAADQLSLAGANGVLGNPLDAAALEITLTGPTLRFERAISFSVTGAAIDAKLNDDKVPLYEPVAAQPGDLLTCGDTRIGARAYIAFRGGIAGKKFLGSTATFPPAQLGGVDGRAVRKNDVLECANIDMTATQILPKSLRPILSHDFILRACVGPDAALVEPASLERFFSSALLIDRRAGRMGVRMTGIDIALADSRPMNSSAVFPGTVQCPPDGAPFLLLADAQTLGGYPRIAQLIAADLPLAGQIRPGDRVWFRKVTETAARDITLQKQALLRAHLSEFSFF